ncbi:MAG: hypothetical protein M0P69_11605 [Bacteroidales bacterium]|jgi:hypothetical protein|nr:hypothetical protein [Candidatus Cloacimonadota bacterium]MCK9326127.1 hypothetical protein [Bacteroidales bacterium]MDD3551666.1 hypothetical protein [Methanothrix soehngenii]NCC84391.1 hypothetical protein [Clostridia bacterium]
MRFSKFTLFFFVLVIPYLFCSCAKEEEPVYLGKWVLEKAEPRIDSSYFQSYIHIKADKSFELYDSSQELLVTGQPEHFSMKGLKLALTNPSTGEVYLFTIISRKQDILVLRTSVFGSETTLTLHKISN